MHLRASGAGEHRSQESDCPRSEHQGPVAGGQGGGLCSAQGVTAWLHQGAEDGVQRFGQRVQRPREDGNLLGQRTRSPVADPDFITVVAHVLVPPLAPAAAAIAHHHIAHDAAADPLGVHAFANGGDHARPLMT
jgi:hypothetical protein